MKLFRISTILLLLVFATTACEKSLEELNENPNEPAEVSAQVLITSAQRRSINSMVTESFLLGNNIAQLTAKTLRTEADEYNWNAFPTVWEQQYLALTDLVDAERIAIENGNPQMQAVSLIMQAYIFSTLTMAYGDIPYTEAIQGLDGDNFTPAYDEQKTILFGENESIDPSDIGILDVLEMADGLLQEEGSITGDIINENNPMLWRRFANSMKLRILLHSSSNMDDLSMLQTQFQNTVNNKPIMEGNAQSAILEYLNSFPNNYPLFPLKQGDFDAVVMSDRLVGRLDTLYQDPRLGVYARPDNILTIDTMPSAEPQFSGAANGDETGDDDDGNPCSKGGSRLGLRYYDYPGQPTGNITANGLLMTYAEVELILAEAANRGWIGADAETHYRNGIQASMDYYNVDYANWGWSDFDDFYNNSGVSYNDDLSQIWEQQWIAIFFHGLEPYFHTRRWVHEASSNFTVGDVEFLRAPCANLNMDMLPIRFPYPGEEGTLNSANYDEAVSRLGGSNSQNAAMWLMED